MTFPHQISGATSEPDGEVGDAHYNDHDALALAGFHHSVGSHQNIAAIGGHGRGHIFDGLLDKVAIAVYSFKVEIVAKAAASLNIDTQMTTR